MKRYRFTIHFALFASLYFATASVSADELLMVRSTQPFPEAMLSLETSIKDHGYTVTRVQRVDVGLKKYGFKTDKYRIVFFGKKREIQELDKRFPRLIPYMPLNFTIFAEQDDTIITAVNPSGLKPYYSDPALQPVLTRWENDLRDILNDLR